MNTPSNRLMYRVYVWDRKMNETEGIYTWSGKVKTILNEHNLGDIFEKQELFSSKATIEQLKSSMYKKQQELVKHECESKPKLRTFLLFKDFANLSPHVGKPLSFVERRMISKLRLGILPIRIETARYLRPILPENQRICYCNSGEVESEYYVLFTCPIYNNLREAWMKKLTIPGNFRYLPKQDQLNLVLNKPENVKHTAQYLVSLMDLRSLKNTIY